ncbi:hypothetical protein EOPP23_07745 [Endozoicomonas sp. OPT23]|uniref:AraC family transcriptional regulator n=1 Tax=Endozoicomonas sp. OPT23 TaxID=2072845 RepID=UPI00129B8BD3|nr:AraC family transcriptional regulator [Endozoicomonas sp. OPT23]MRI32875.1 hypothetical protein [Endozoicomonas sp. OPT23]
MTNYVINFMIYPLLDYAYETGVDFAELGGEIESIRQNPDEYTESPLFWGLIEKIESSCKEGNASLKCAEKRTPVSYGFTSDMFKLEPNMKEAYRLVCKYLPIKTDLVDFAIIENEKNCEIILLIKHDEPKVVSFLREYIFAAEMHFIKSLKLYNSPFESIHYSHSLKKGSRREYFERFFGCPVYFDQPRTAIVINDQARLIGPYGFDTGIKQYLIDKAERQLAIFQDEFLLAQRVKNTINSLLPNGPVRLETVALSLGLTEKTLQRSLRKNGTGFTQLYNGVRMESLVGHINRGVAFQKIASLLGFSDARALNHWFKQQKGMSPSEYREQLKM